MPKGLSDCLSSLGPRGDACSDGQYGDMHPLRGKPWEEGFRGTTQTGLTDAESEEIAHRLHAQNTAREEDRTAAPRHHRCARLPDSDQSAGDINLDIFGNRHQALLVPGLNPTTTTIVFVPPPPPPHHLPPPP